MVDLVRPNLLKKFRNKILRRQTFVFHSQNYCLPPVTFPADHSGDLKVDHFTFPTVNYTPDPLDLLKSHPGVLKIEHFPLDGDIKETYRWYVTIKSSSKLEIESLLKPYLRISPRYCIYHKRFNVEHYKTNGFYFIQMVAGYSCKNVNLIRETQALWAQLGWQWIAENYACGWISAKAARIREKGLQC